MTADFWNQSARLMQAAASGRNARSPRVNLNEVMRGPLSQLAQHVSQQDSDELWRFVIITADDHYIRNADLRELLRREDIPVPIAP